MGSRSVLWYKLSCTFYLTAYIDKNNQPIRIDDRIAEEVIKNAREVLSMAKRGINVIFPDVFKIYRELEQ